MAPVSTTPIAPAGAGRAHDHDGAEATDASSDGSGLRVMVFMLLGVALLGGGFWVVKPRPKSMPSGAVPFVAAPVQAPTQAPTPAPVPATATAPVTRASALATVAAGRLAGPPIALRLTEGQPAHLEVTADTAGELHLHGYDLARHVAKGETASLDFSATRTGRFPLEWHGPQGRHVELGVIEVYPS